MCMWCGDGWNQWTAKGLSFFFFFNDTATTEIYTLSLHDALPISYTYSSRARTRPASVSRGSRSRSPGPRSEEHTSELQSPCNLVCRLLLEKKKISRKTIRETPNGNASKHKNG